MIRTVADLIRELSKIENQETLVATVGPDRSDPTLWTDGHVELHRILWHGATTLIVCHRAELVGQMALSALASEESET